MFGVVFLVNEESTIICNVVTKISLQHATFTVLFCCAFSRFSLVHTMAGGLVISLYMQNHCVRTRFDEFLDQMFVTCEETPDFNNCYCPVFINREGLLAGPIAK